MTNDPRALSRQEQQLLGSSRLTDQSVNQCMSLPFSLPQNQRRIRGLHQSTPLLCARMALNVWLPRQDDAVTSEKPLRKLLAKLGSQSVLFIQHLLCAENCTKYLGEYSKALV